MLADYGDFSDLWFGNEDNKYEGFYKQLVEHLSTHKIEDETLEGVISDLYTKLGIDTELGDGNIHLKDYVKKDEIY